MHMSHNRTIRRDHSLENNFEESKSEHSFEDNFDVQDDIILDYHSTNLITKPNIYVSDVHLESISLNTLEHRVDHIHKHHDISNFQVFECDPKKALKDAKVKTHVKTLVNYEEIAKFCEYAVHLHLQYLNESSHSQPQTHADELQHRLQLSKQIIHDHTRQALNQDEYSNLSMEALILRKASHKDSNAAKLEAIDRLNQSKAIYLANDCNLTAKQISKRLKLKYYKYKNKRFKKLSNRIRSMIQNQIISSTKPLQLADIQSMILRETKVRVSKSMLNRYLRAELNVSYRKVRPIKLSYNNFDARLQRQYAAANYIRLLYERKRIINVDESVLSLNEHRQRGWLIKGVKNMATLPNRPNHLNLIAGISNLGDLFYTVNKGLTNSNTFLLFIIKLCEHLHSIDKKWRNNTVILIDNASYHRASTMKDQLHKMRVPFMYLGPYQFKMAPIEVFFSFIKGHDLNPLNSKLTSKQNLSSIMYQERCHYLHEGDMHAHQSNEQSMDSRSFHACFDSCTRRSCIINNMIDAISQMLMIWPVEGFLQV